MKETNRGLRISLRQVSQESSFQRVLSAIPVGICLLLGLSIVVCNWFPSVNVQWWLMFLGMAVFFILLCLLEFTGMGKWINLAFMAAIMTGCFAFQNQVLNGMRYLANDIMGQISKVTGRIYLEYTVSSTSSVLWGAVPMLLLLVIFIHLTIQTGKILFSLVIFLPVYGAVFFGVFPIDTGLLILGGGFILLLVRSSTSQIQSQGFWGIPSWILLAAICGIFALGLGNWLGQLYNQDKKSELEAAIHDYLYDKDTNSMPEGNLKNLSAWKKSDTPALEITMTSPQKMYLRGQIYEVYTGTKWEAIKNEDLAEYENLFYWLHQEGFYGQSQLAAATSYVAQTKQETMTIKNLSACEEHGYLPYALAQTDSLEADRIGDSYLNEMETAAYLSGSIPEWYLVQQNLSSAQNRTNIGQYLAVEDAYEEYVGTVDLQMTKESWTVLDKVIDDTATSMTLSQIRTYIRKYLEENLIYDEEINTLNGSGDFISYTLGRSSSGYNVHYATIATMLLRYFGVPARYVEGYFISEEEALSYEPGQTMILTEEHAHAWTEYYLPGVGFIPFEVTPGYMDDEENELGSLLNENTEVYTGNKLKYAQVEEPEQITEKEQNRFAFAMKPVYVIALAVLLLLIIGLLVLLKRRRFTRAMERMEQAAPRESITMRYGYARKLLSSCEEIHIEWSEEAEALNREAMFSNHDMTDEQCQQMNLYSGCVLRACKEKWTIAQKIRYWIWDCLY